MKGFYYDTLLDPENICNLETERRTMEKGVLGGKKLIVYGPRNFGKTSLVKNVIIPFFQKKHRKHFVLFVDLMEVKGLESIHQRVHSGFERAFSAAFPAKNLFERARQFVSQLRPEIAMDSLTGMPTLSLGTTTGHSIRFPEIFRLLKENIIPKIPTLIILDEFQDIAAIEEAQGLFRQSLQEFHKIPIILMGSKKHLLSRLFAKPNAPLASFGEDVEFQPIAYAAYHAYITERFRLRKLRIEDSVSQEIQDALFRVPEAINIVCADLFERYEHQTIGLPQVFQSIEHVVTNRRSRFEEWLANFSAKEEEILVSLAKHGPIVHPTGQTFLKSVHATARTISLTIDYFRDRSIIEKTPAGFRVAEPLLYYYLQRMR